jgi:tetratricopeptide (TPR) repeat protein
MVAAALNSVAQALRIQKRYEEAERFYHRAINIAEKTIGTQHPDTAKIYGNLGHLYFERGRYSGAARLYERAIATLERGSGAGDPLIPDLRRNLSMVFRAQGRVTESERITAGFMPDGRRTAPAP